MNFNPFGSKPRGFEQLTSMSAAKHLTPPAAGASFVELNAEAQAVRWRDDGTAPTATVGMLIPVGTNFTYQGDLSKIQFIEVTSGAILNASYYAATGGLLAP